MLNTAKLVAAITLTVGAVSALPSQAFAQYGSYGSAYTQPSAPGIYGPGYYSPYVSNPSGYGPIVTANVAYSYGGYGYGAGRQYGGPFFGPFRTDSAPLTGGGG